MEFLNEKHEERFNELKVRANIKNDKERLVVMYILASNDELYKKVDKIYDFNKNKFIAEVDENDKIIFNNVVLSSSEKALANLAFDLFAYTNTQSVIQTFSNLDSKNFEIAINAIRFRFNK